MKMFISYSHADGSHLELFKKHLVTLERNKVLQSWYDQEMVAGDNLDKTIRDNITESDIVVFLISVDFLNSFYCYEKEFLKTVEELENSGQRIVPIILRDCDWQDGLLDTYKCVTVDDKPITSHPKEDTAWMSVIKDIRKVIEALKEKKLQKTETVEPQKDNCVQLRSEYIEELNSTGIALHHQLHGNLSLSDIYIYPQIKTVTDDIDRIDFAKNSEDLLSYNKIISKTIIVGDEQIGKTSLAKMLIKKYHSVGILPVYLDGRSIKKSNPERLLNRVIKTQFDVEDSTVFFSCEKDRVLLIDDFHNISINEKAQGVLLKNLFKIFDKIILFADNSSRYIDSEFIRISEFDQFEILPFGHKLKSNLVDKWNSIGQEDTLDIRELHTKNNVTTQHLDSIIRKNVLPAKPIYLLIVLQSIESAKTNDYSLTSYGHCYQYLITQNFEKASVRAGELDTFFNYMTEFSYFIYKNGGRKISDSQLKQFKKEYSKSYFIKSHKDIIIKLVDTGIITDKDDEYRFCYKYIYYFYVAKYLSDHINEQEIKNIIETLCANIHIEKNANILIFLTHHSKDESIIDDILLHVSEIFNDVNPANLDREDTGCLQEFMEMIPEKVYEQRDVEEERNRYLSRKDELDAIRDDQQRKQSNNKDRISDKSVEEYENSDIFLNISQSLKSIDLIGQILRNRYGSLNKTQLRDLGEVAIGAGFKLLKFYLNLTSSVQNEITFLIEKMIRENGKRKDKDVIKEAKKVFLALNYGVAYGIVKKIAKSIGSDAIVTLLEDLRPVFSNSPAFRILEVAVRLDYTTKIPKREIEQVFKELESIPITKRLLRDIIIQHAHLHHTDFRDKQWINNILGISINSQRLIDLHVH